MYIQRVGDKWRVFVEKHGLRPSKLCDTKAEAQRWGHAKEIELDALKGSKGRTFAAAAAHYLKTVSPGKAPGALTWETRRLAALEEFFGSKTPLAKIDSARVGQWRDHRLQTVSGSTVNREANLLRNLFKLARVEWKWISHDPFQGVRLPRHNPPREPTWPWRLIKRVLRARRTGKTLEVIHAFHVALHTAMRLSEILAARVEGKVAVLPKDKTSRVPVKVPLARKGAVLLKRYGPFTVGANEASTLFSTLCKELLIEGLTFHDSRATALTLLARRMDVMTLARISRHKDINILMDSYYRERVEDIAARV